MSWSTWLLVFSGLIWGAHSNPSYPEGMKDEGSTRPLFTVNGQSKKSKSVCCNTMNLKTCIDVLVNPDVLVEKGHILIGNVTLMYISSPPPNGYYYTSMKGDTAIFTMNKKTNNIFGSLKTAIGESFALEPCSPTSYAWIEYDVQSFEEDIAMEQTIPPGRERESVKSVDTTTQATYSVMFYYTPDFAANTSDIPGFIDQVLAETNQGYINSGVPLTVTKHCIEAATVNEIDDENEQLYGSQLLSAFRYMKPTLEELRNTADAASLLFNDIPGLCGRGYFNIIDEGLTLSISRKSCALGHFTFGHELGHNMGLHHDPDQDTNWDYPYGHGHLIAPGNGNPGVRTIMAYKPAAGGYPKVNYYSNPDILCLNTTTPTGVAGKSNNARVLMENRFKMQNVGDESSSCSVQSSECCDWLSLTTADSDTVSSQGSKLGMYSKTGEYLNDFPVYEHVSGSYSLYKTKNKWKVDQIVGGNSGDIKSSRQNGCPENVTKWKIRYGSGFVQDKTFKVNCNPGCIGEPDQQECCTATSPCELYGGDCDSDVDCEGSLICGHYNCKYFHATADATTDCCINRDCRGDPDQRSCCTSSSPCGLYGGDCDYDEDCEGSLVCGSNNCKDFHPTADATTDCCILKRDCKGEPDQRSCCTTSSPCGLYGGDCDSDEDCEGSLVCGSNNCKYFHSTADATTDCCINTAAELIPEITTTTTTTPLSTKPEFEMNCPDNSNGDEPTFYPNPEDCGSYYVCEADQSPVLMSCPPGLFWDTTLNTCNWPDMVVC